MSEILTGLQCSVLGCAECIHYRQWLEMHKPSQPGECHCVKNHDARAYRFHTPTQCYDVNQDDSDKAVEGMVEEFVTAFGAPMAKNANEAVRNMCRKLIGLARGGR